MLDPRHRISDTCHLILAPPRHILGLNNCAIKKLLLSHVSCLTSPVLVSCFLSYVSFLMSPVCLTSTVSHILSHVSCFTLLSLVFPPPSHLLDCNGEGVGHRRIELEDKAKVVASYRILAALSVLPRSFWNKPLNSTVSFKKTESKQLARQGGWLNRLFQKDQGKKMCFNRLRLLRVLRQLCYLSLLIHFL